MPELTKSTSPQAIPCTVRLPAHWIAALDRACESELRSRSDQMRLWIRLGLIDGGYLCSRERGAEAATAS